MPDVLVKLIVAALAVWRASVAIWYEDGPFDLYKDIRGYIEKRGTPKAVNRDGELAFTHNYFWEGILSQLACFWCMTFWVSLPIAVVIMLPWYWWTGLIPFALSGVAMLLGGAGRTVRQLTLE